MRIARKNYISHNTYAHLHHSEMKKGQKLTKKNEIHCGYDKAGATIRKIVTKRRSDCEAPLQPFQEHFDFTEMSK